jgi:cytochrome P450
MQHPEQMRKLQANPRLIHSTVEEMLRYNGPVETPTLRFVVEPTDYKGHRLRTGDILLPSLLAANRDPKVFPNPDTFDITRSPNPHVAFGFGIHYCLGAPLARMEAAIAINALVQRYPNIRLSVPEEALVWNDSLLIHGMQSLPVRLD